MVTGGAAGLGRAYAERLARDGALVWIADIADPEESVRSIVAGGGDAQGGHCDVTDPASVEAFRDHVIEQHGRCDILVNNAGIYPVKAFEDTTLEDLRQINAVNLEGVFLMSQAFIPAMKARRYGRIVNISSTTAWLAVPGFSAYIASKMAVIGLTRAMATELGAHGITVNCACPSLVRTDTTEAGPQREMFAPVAEQQAIKRTQVPGDMVGTIAFLCSDDSAFMTGQTLVTDGGLIRL